MNQIPPALVPIASIDWDGIDAGKHAPEDSVVAGLLASAPLDAPDRAAVRATAIALVEAARRVPVNAGAIDGFLRQFSLGTDEGVALMCLAEALLRTPDDDTRDRLIAEKIGSADWERHLGQADSLFVNASAWGLMLSGRLMDVAPEARRDLGGYLHRLVARVGEPVIRQAVSSAIRMMGRQFVLGNTIERALARAKQENMLCSFDMLGEGARTEDDAERYFRIYGHAVEAVGKAARGMGPERGHGVSVKLSALSPHYRSVQEPIVLETLYPRLLALAEAAARHDINLAIDAEEADRLVLSLKLVERLVHAPELQGWQGLGVVVQAYQKRAPHVIAGLAQLARASGRRIMVRLVKGAYWDSEVKWAQQGGMPDYPVFTTKAATDLSYLACARSLIAASPALYPQFASHNAHSLAAVRHMAARAGVTIEHQRLHGMGEALYRAAQDHYGPLLVRAYAPVGGHEDLLPYLVRRLLENGANSSFVHALLDARVPAASIVVCPVAEVERWPARHPRLCLPGAIHPGRRNPPGRDWSQASARVRAAAETEALRAGTLSAGPIVDGRSRPGAGQPGDIRNPFDTRRLVGTVQAATVDDIDHAATLARTAQPAWDRAGGAVRAGVLRATADLIEASTDRLVALLAAEAGKTLADGVAEVREAIDFCRYYALLAEAEFAGPRTLSGPVGERNRWSLHGRGTFACISPWNFPLAIFTGQIAAALAAGNAVLAKPAEQTPLVASVAVRLFHEAGLDPRLLALLPGDGATIGAALTAHAGVDGVAFTGGTDTAWAINRALAARAGPIIPFIAETGGLNAMFVDTTALREQVVDDAILSAFGSAGQRCSALRMLFLPAESADAIIDQLVGAMNALVLGDPASPATDVGPVIDAAAHAALRRHLSRLETEARIVARRDTAGIDGHGHLFGPVIAEVPTADFLEREVFGPILHVCRYPAGNPGPAARALAARGYGLTLGIHSRIEGFAAEIIRLVPAGNIYVNRGMTGAVVGAQPFGGVGLSGTGPKAGGPHALTRYATERAVSTNIMAAGGDPMLFNLGNPLDPGRPA